MTNGDSRPSMHALPATVLTLLLALAFTDTSHAGNLGACCDGQVCTDNGDQIACDQVGGFFFLGFSCNGLIAGSLHAASPTAPASTQVRHCATRPAATLWAEYPPGTARTASCVRRCPQGRAAPPEECAWPHRPRPNVRLCRVSSKGRAPCAEIIRRVGSHAASHRSIAWRSTRQNV